MEMLWQTFIVTFVLVTFGVLPLMLSVEIAKKRNRDAAKAFALTLIFNWIATIGFWLMLKERSRETAKKSSFVCSSCGHVGVPIYRVKGSGMIELVLWCFFLLPGLIYSIWRSGSRHPTCPFCGNSALIPSHSPLGKKLIDELKQVASEHSA